jgi:hypothetical protein
MVFMVTYDRDADAGGDFPKQKALPKLVAPIVDAVVVAQNP